ncbi:MAG TPA: CvpA family protein, partial [Actinomycetota bacterium]|nr:CvpA family protein [Actinomycetota bacterium]
MNLLDAGIILLAAASLYTGFRRGAALQLITYSGLILGLVIGSLLAPVTAGLAEDPYVQASLALVT